MFPENKRAHRFIHLDACDMFVPEGRSDGYTVIEINMMKGRSKERRKRLIKLLFERVEKDLGIDPVDLEVTIVESEPENWGFRGMTGDEAQLDYDVNVYRIGGSCVVGWESENQRQ